jgi:peptide/nickel transport system ATP-binding protein
MRQRVMIAIALSCRPRLLIADEPTTALDVTVQRQILGLLSTLQGELHMAMMLITHDLGVVANNTRRVIVMYAGQDVETASTTTIFTSVRHPYTEALMRSIPHLDHPPHAPLRAIAGRPPDMRNPPVGCRFAPRCPYAQEQCVREVPPRFEEPGGHTYRCFYPVGTDAGREAQERNERAGVTAAGLVVQPVSTSTATATSPVTATV